MPRKARAGLRDDLISTAENIVREQGVVALTARTLAHEAKCAVGSIYNVFGDLDDLIIGINMRTMARLVSDLGGVRKAGTAPEDQLMALAFGYIRFIMSEQNLWSALMQHHPTDGRELPDRYLGEMNGLFAEIEASIAPLFKEHDHEEHIRAARILWSNLHGLCSLAISDKLDLVAGDNVETLAEDMIFTYLAGIKATR